MSELCFNSDRQEVGTSHRWEVPVAIQLSPEGGPGTQGELGGKQKARALLGLTALRLAGEVPSILGRFPRLPPVGGGRAKHPGELGSSLGPASPLAQ